MEFLNFSEISQKISFQQLLDWLNIPYSTQNGEIKGEGFIINTAKNLYLNPNGKEKGSVINFLANNKGLDVRSAASELKKQFLSKVEPKKEPPNLELHYCKFLEEKGISEDLAKEYEIGLVKQHSIIAGKIGFKAYDENGQHSGYIAYNPKDDSWFFPKGFKRTLYNAYRIKSDEVIVTVSIWETLEFIENGIPSVSLVGKTMTDIQAEQLSRFSRVVLVHPEPDNIVIRLARLTYVKVSPPL